METAAATAIRVRKGLLIGADCSPTAVRSWESIVQLRERMRTAIVGVWLVSAVCAAAQVPSAPTDAARLRFEETSIRPSASDRTFTVLRQNMGGRFSAESIPVSNLIQQAYRLFRFQIIGGPDWIDRD